MWFQKNIMQKKRIQNSPSNSKIEHIKKISTYIIKYRTPTMLQVETNNYTKLLIAKKSNVGFWRMVE